MWLALKVAETACHHEEAQEAKRLIWRRVFNRDDWKSINDTQMKDDQQVVTNLAKTALCECLYDGVSHRKLTLSLLIYANTHALIEDPREPFQPMSPHEALGVFTEQLDRRFHNFDADFQAKLKTAMKDEDKVLKKNIESYRLAGWVEQTLEVARSEVNGFVDKVTQNLANGPTA
jgi:nuclear pore complex protein Nup133